MKQQRFISSRSLGSFQDATLRELNREMQKSGLTVQCPDDSPLAALAEGRLSRPERESLHLHLAQCESCLETYSLLCSLLRDAAQNRHSRRSWTPMALAASLVLVVISFFLFGPHGRDLAPGMELAADNAQFTVNREKDQDGKRAKDETSVESSSPSRREGKPPVSPPDGKKVDPAGPPAPKQDRVRLQAEVPEPGAKSRVQRQSRPAQKSGISAKENRVRHFEAAEEAPKATAPGDSHKWAEKIRIDVQPANTPAGRISVVLAINARGMISDMTIDPPDSPLAAPVRRALQRHSFPPPSSPVRFLRLTIEWNGESWKIQSSEPSNPNESAGNDPASF
ncbi:MAG TPA: zf-HC2 domain-containing protein [Candidatus Aminicenantes bacterium]|nr:zf-HC2 domain-containing protein [Candidatus Aminicenantes bacterium]